MDSKNQPSSKNVRVNRPERSQIEMRFLALDEMLPQDHRARIVWQFVESLNVEPLYADFKATAGEKGRNAIAPEVLLALWLLATIDSVSSARALERRTKTDMPYLWLCGGVTVNYHTLSDFRSNNAAFLEKMLVDTVTAMMQQGFVTLDTIGQDGMRVRASAGSSSFRREPTLSELHRKAEEHVKRLQEEDAAEPDTGQSNARREAAQKRAAAERAERIAESLKQVETLREQKEKRQKGDGVNARCSTTDPDARKMKMGDGGFRPAYNVQFATDGDSRVIAAVDVTNSGSDRGQLADMHAKVTEHYGKTPKHQLVDSAFVTQEDVTKVERAGTQVVSTVPRAAEMTKRGQDPHAKQPKDTDEFAAFRQRMIEPVYQALYKQRPSVAEFPNAEARNRGLTLLKVRGLEKVKSVALLFAVTFNLMRMLHLQAI
jgi:transposase